ncbi:MAG TPA: BtpA/SgcQ family protein [Pyrinomonadaceae bacterium]|nr:BtpA/SgcQ family protein [Pyrinomonadaceae bacterium]
MFANSSLAIPETAKAAEFSLSTVCWSMMIVIGVATGQPAGPDEENSVSRAVSVPTIAGSGITSENLPDYSEADVFIVGSSIKQDGLWSNPIDPDRARALVRAFCNMWSSERTARLRSHFGRAGRRTVRH